MAFQPGDENGTLGMDQTVVLTTRRGIKIFELIVNRHGDLEPKDNDLPSKIIPMCLTELRAIWNIGAKDYLGVKGKWELIEAPPTGICGWYCRAFIADAPDLQDDLSWNDLFVGELRPNPNPDPDPGHGPDPNPYPNPNPNPNLNLPR